MILGADWMYKHSPVTFDLPNMTLTIKDGTGQMITFINETLPTKPCSPTLQEMDHLLDDMLSGALLWMQPVTMDSEIMGERTSEISKLLNDFQDVFKEPSGLPP